MTSTPPSKLAFVSIGDGIWLLKGETTKVNDELKHPTVILICGWMGAQLPHLHKYTQVYYDLYPGATQLLIQCEPSWFYKTQAANERKLLPAVEVLTSLGCIPPTDQRILVHSFSNGGALQLSTLTKILPAPSAAQLPISAIIIDSAPGKPELTTFNRAFTAQIRPEPLRIFVTLVTTAIYGFLALLRLLGVPDLDVAQILRDALLNERFLPWIDKKTPRLFIYSKKDQLVRWQHVQEHIEDARRHGLNVHEDMYDVTPHVAHARVDPARYWSKVKETWEGAVKAHST